MNADQVQVEPNEEEIEATKLEKEGWFSGNNQPPAPGLYHVIRESVKLVATTAFWDGAVFTFFGEKQGYGHKGVFRWRGPLSATLGTKRIPAKERVKLATRTESPVNEAMQKRASDPLFLRLLHVAMGLSTEAGEFLDQLKKHLFYEKDLDLVNLLEEMGDSDWYMNLGCDAMGVTMKEVEEANIKKLAKRFGERFSKDGALIRNLIAEREVLETELVVTEQFGDVKIVDVVPKEKKQQPFSKTYTHSSEHPNYNEMSDTDLARHNMIRVQSTGEIISTRQASERGIFTGKGKPNKSYTPPKEPHFD